MPTNPTPALQLDQASWTVPELVDSLADLGDGFADADEGVWLYAESMRVTMPVEVEVQAAGNNLLLGLTPPTQTADTTVFPVFGRLTLTVDVLRTQLNDADGRGTNQ